MMKFPKATAVMFVLPTTGCAGLNAESINRALGGSLDSETVAAGLASAANRDRTLHEHDGQGRRSIQM